MWVMRPNIVDWGYFKIQTLHEILKTQNQHQVEFCAFLDVEHVYRSVGCARSKRQCRTALLNQRSYRWMLVCAMDGSLALDLWDLVIEVLRTTQRIPKPTQACTRETSVKTQITPKIEQVLDQNVDLSNIDQVPSNAHLSEKESKLYTFEDDEAVIKIIIKDRSPTIRHVSRTHFVALDWLFDRVYQDPKVQIMYVESQNQLADILTKGSFTRDERHNLMHLFHIMNDTSFSCSHFYSHSFLSAGKQSEMWRRSQESSSLGSPTAKARACCLVSRESGSVGQHYSSNPKSLGGTRDSQVWSWEERNEKSGWYSFQHASGNREYTRKVVQNIKNQLRHDECISEISINSEKMNISIWTRFMASSMQAALHMDPSNEKNLELFKNSEFENINDLFGIPRMMIEGNSEKCISCRHCENTREKTGCCKKTSNQVDKSKSGRLLGLRIMLGKTARSRRCNKKVEWSSSVNFEDVSYFQRIARVRWGFDWPRVENCPKEPKHWMFSRKKIKQTYKGSTSHLKNSVIE